MEGKGRILSTVGAIAATCAVALGPGQAVSGSEGSSVKVYGTWRVFTKADGLPHDRIRSLRVSGGQVWVGTEKGLALHEDGIWKKWGAQDGLPWPAISAIDVDEKTHDVWLGTWGGGLVRFCGGRFEQFNQFNSGLAGDLVFAVAVIGDRVWAATNGGLSSFDFIRDEWDLHAERRADGPETAIVGLSSQKGELFAAAWCGGLRWFDLANGKWTLLGKPPRTAGLQPPPVSAGEDTTIALTTIGRVLWWAEQTQLVRRDSDGRLDSRRVPRMDPWRDSIRCIAARDESSVWLGTEEGLLELADWDSDMWVSYPRGGKAARSFARLSRGGKGMETRSLDSRASLEGIRCVALDDEGIWAGTPHGLIRGTNEKSWDSLPQATAENRQDDEDSTVPPLIVSRPSVTIGVVAKAAKTIVLPGETAQVKNRNGSVDRYGAQLAVARIDPHNGKPNHLNVDIVMSNSGFARYGWGLAEDDIPRFAIQRNAIALVGHLGPDSRIMSAVILGTGLPLVNSASTAASIDERANPWVFRCRSNDPRQHELLLGYVIDSLHKTRVGIVRIESPLAQMHLNWWISHARTRGHGALIDMTLHQDGGNLPDVLDSICSAEVDVILTWCDVSTASAILRGMRDRGSAAVFIGGDEIVCNEFVSQIGRDPGTILAPYPCQHRKDRAARAEFVREYARGWPRRITSVDPELTFDAVHHLLEAVQIAAPNPEAVREVLQEMDRPCMARLDGERWVTCELPDEQR